MWKIQNYLKENAPGCEDNLPLKKQDSYSIEDHLKAMVCALLSNQRIWNALRPHLAEADEIFSYYDPDAIAAADPADLCGRLQGIQGGSSRIAS